MEINMRNIKLDINRSRGKVFAYLKDVISEETVRKYVTRETKLVLGDLVSKTESLMIFLIVNENISTPKTKTVKEEVIHQPEKKQNIRRKRTRKQSVKKNTTTS